MKYQYLLGPLQSRRLGLSLGINLFEKKTCSLNCVYCECGPTLKTTTIRREYVPTESVIKEIDDYFNGATVFPDSLTFSGYGEPTLHSGIGRIISHIKTKYPFQMVTLLTNATLFSDEFVRKEVRDCDMIIPSVDALSEKVMDIIYGNPDPPVNPELFMNGLLELKSEYRGKLAVEMFVIEGINDTEEELKLLKDFFMDLKPDEIQLNTLDRPAAYHWVKKADASCLEKIADYFNDFHVQCVLNVGDSSSKKFFDR